MIISETQKPPLEKMPPSAHSFERDTDPFNPAVCGWMILDFWGNPIGFIADGTEVQE